MVGAGGTLEVLANTSGVAQDWEYWRTQRVTETIFGSDYEDLASKVNARVDEVNGNTTGHAAFSSNPEMVWGNPITPPGQDTFSNTATVEGGEGTWDGTTSQFFKHIYIVSIRHHFQ